MVKYSICSANLNMAETLDESIRSIMGQVNDDYGMVVIDGGSTDGSLEKLEELSEEYNLRYFVSEEGNLGHDRNLSIEKAEGKYVLPQLDMDDRYFDNVIPRFVNFYHSIEDEFDEDFFCSGSGINIAPHTLMLEYQYKDMDRWEDKVLWNKLAKEGKIVSVDMPPAKEKLSTDHFVKKIKSIARRNWVSIRKGFGFDWSVVENKLEDVPRRVFNWRNKKS